VKLFRVNSEVIIGHIRVSGRYEMSVGPWSLTFDVCSPENRPPFVDLSFLKSGKTFGRLLIRRENLLSEFSKTLPYPGVRQSVLLRH
jgi:hypothetical protein